DAEVLPLQPPPGLVKIYAAPAFVPAVLFWFAPTSAVEPSGESATNWPNKSFAAPPMKGAFAADAEVLPLQPPPGLVKIYAAPAFVPAVPLTYDETSAVEPSEESALNTPKLSFAAPPVRSRSLQMRTLSRSSRR